MQIDGFNTVGVWDDRYFFPNLLSIAGRADDQDRKVSDFAHPKIAQKSSSSQKFQEKVQRSPGNATLNAVIFWLKKNDEKVSEMSKLNTFKLELKFAKA